MKQIWPTYAYSPTTNVLTLTGLNIDRDQLLLVTAADRGRIMYNFADSSVTASAFTSGANTALTLVATTAGLTTTAALVIYYDDQLTSTTVTISSLPAISGTVTANVIGFNYGESEPAKIPIKFDISDNFYIPIGPSTDPFPLPIYGTVTVGSALPAGTNRIGVVTIGAGTVTIGAGTSQIGSVTASISGTVPISGTVTAMAGTNFRTAIEDGILDYVNNNNFPVNISSPLPAGTAQIGSVTASISGTVPISISSVTVGNSVTIGSLPAISGTVTANLAISSTAITSGSFASLTSATLVPGNVARKMATVYNLGAGQLFINAGSTATTIGGGFMVALSSGDFYECDYTTTTLSAIFATAGTASWMSH